MSRARSGPRAARCTRRALATLLILFSPTLAAGAEDRLTLELGEVDGVEVGMTGKVCAEEEIGGERVRACAVSFEVVEVSADTSLATVTHRTGGISGSGIVEFDQALQPPGRTAPKASEPSQDVGSPRAPAERGRGEAKPRDSDALAVQGISAPPSGPTYRKAAPKDAWYVDPADWEYLEWDRLTEVGPHESQERTSPHLAAADAVWKILDGRASDLLDGASTASSPDDNDARSLEKQLTTLERDLLVAGRHLMVKLHAYHLQRESSGWFFHLVSPKGMPADASPWFYVSRERQSGLSELTAVFRHDSTLDRPAGMPVELLAGPFLSDAEPSDPWHRGESEIGPPELETRPEPLIVERFRKYAARISDYDFNPHEHSQRIGNYHTTSAGLLIHESCGDALGVRGDLPRLFGTIEAGLAVAYDCLANGVYTKVEREMYPRWDGPAFPAAIFETPWDHINALVDLLSLEPVEGGDLAVSNWDTVPKLICHASSEYFEGVDSSIVSLTREDVDGAGVLLETPNRFGEDVVQPPVILFDLAVNQESEGIRELERSRISHSDSTGDRIFHHLFHLLGHDHDPLRQLDAPNACQASCGFVQELDFSLDGILRSRKAAQAAKAICSRGADASMDEVVVSPIDGRRKPLEAVQIELLRDLRQLVPQSCSARREPVPDSVSVPGEEDLDLFRKFVNRLVQRDFAWWKEIEPASNWYELPIGVLLHRSCADAFGADEGIPNIAWLLHQTLSYSFDCLANDLYDLPSSLSSAGSERNNAARELHIPKLLEFLQLREEADGRVVPGDRDSLFKIICHASESDFAVPEDFPRPSADAVARTCDPSNPADVVEVISEEYGHERIRCPVVKLNRTPNNLDELGLSEAIRRVLWNGLVFHELFHVMGHQHSPTTEVEYGYACQAACSRDLNWISPFQADQSWKEVLLPTARAVCLKHPDDPMGEIFLSPISDERKPFSEIQKEMLRWMIGTDSP